MDALRQDEPRFRDRRQAGRMLARHLVAYASRADVLVLALPRGGVPVGYAVAVALDLEFDVFSVRKIGVVGHEELAMGAVASGGFYFVNKEVVRAFRTREADFFAALKREQAELERRERSYRADRDLPPVHEKAIILIDDGLATGATMRVAVAALRDRQPAKIIVAVPVAAREICEELLAAADGVISLHTPEPFYGVGRWYDDFSQVGDKEVRRLLHRARTRPRARVG